MSDDLRCPTCSSESIPLSVKEALGEVVLLQQRPQDALMSALETLYLYGGDATGEPHWNKTMHDIVGHISPRTEVALRDIGADAVWRFFKAEFRKAAP